jgi:hypothetical protein
MRLNFHEAQEKAWLSERMRIFMLCGLQTGKTCFGPHWLQREIERTYKAEDEYNDYIVATPTFPLLDKKLLPEMVKVFDDYLGLAKYAKGDNVMYYNHSNVRIFFASASNPQSIESATAKAAWLDEFGQDDFKKATYDAIEGRLSLATYFGWGRILGTSTIYNFGWFKTDIYDKWLKGDTSIDIIQADSIMNPFFPKDEYYRQMKAMPAWKFDQRYRGVFTKPAGMIYDSFNSNVAVIKRFAIPDSWPRYVGMDFAQSTPTAAIFFACDPATGFMYAYHEYLATGKSVVEHAQDLKQVAGSNMPRKIVGGAPGEDGWRQSFSMAGWHVQKPIVKDLEVGIDKVYTFHKLGKLFVFDDMERYLQEKQSYSRKIVGNDEVTDDIQDKQKYHLMDAERYILSDFNISTGEQGKYHTMWRF